MAVQGAMSDMFGCDVDRYNKLLLIANEFNSFLLQWYEEEEISIEVNGNLGDEGYFIYCKSLKSQVVDFFEIEEAIDDFLSKYDCSFDIFDKDIYIYG